MRSGAAASPTTLQGAGVHATEAAERSRAPTLFEALVNVMYMANRAAAAAAGHDPVSTGVKIFFAAHGTLSLLAYLAFVIFGVLAWQEQRAQRWFFPSHPRLTWTFLVVWTISIASGEALFALRYLV